MKEHKAIMLGDDTPKIQSNLITKQQEKPTSKFIKTDNIERDYGKQMVLLTPLEREVALNLAEGVRHKAIAKLLDIGIRTVKIIANRKHVKAFIAEYVAETTALIKARREQILAQIIEAKLDQVDNLADASDLDIATLLMMLDNMGKEREKAKLQSSNQNQVINILQLIKKDN